MISPTGIVPEELMHAAKKKAVIDWLQAQPQPAAWKRELLLAWAQWVGLRLRRSDYRAVEITGIDR